MSPSRKKRAHQQEMVCPMCDVKAITKSGQFFQCTGCGYGSLDEKEFGGQKTLFDKPEAEGQKKLIG